MPYTPQEAFDKVCAHIKAQGHKSYDSDRNQCLYRNGPDKCAIGALIPDEEYQPEFDGRANSCVVAVAPKVPALQGLSGSFLLKLQEAHDHANEDNFVPSALGLLRVAAREYDLSSAAAE